MGNHFNQVGGKHRMNIEWIGGHGFMPELGEMRLGDKRTVEDSFGRRLVNSKLAVEVVEAKPTKKAKEI